MKCPACGHGEDRVIDSRPVRGGTVVRRRRECEGCGKRFTTYESVAVESPAVMKKDGRREAFDRNKLFTGIEKACQKRPIPRSRLEEIVDTIESEVGQRYPAEVPTREIGERVMDLLRDLDDVAYVRFASVYRQFKDVSQFMESIRSILDRGGRL
ncbi:MAG: transcriptional repressor NrdR [Candidatus Eisenbacteria sp.]|nr:transcriptional repressor NrdR [Candidatus Eisenbacteria bacterium]